MLEEVNGRYQPEHFLTTPTRATTCGHRMVPGLERHDQRPRYGRVHNDLAHFIRDVRKDLAAEASLRCRQMGVDGLNAGGGVKVQSRTARSWMPEFKNVAS